MDDRKRLYTAAGIGIGVLLLLGLIFGAKLFKRTGTEPGPVDVQGPSTTQQVALTAIDLSSAPADVQAAANTLRTSRIGYAIVKPDKTYLIISTGSDALKVKADRADGRPATGTPDSVDVSLTEDPAGERLLILTSPLTNEAIYQFNVGESPAAIPTLLNHHGLTLVPLDAEKRFALVSPEPDAIVTSPLRITGFAQVFEATFNARIVTAKGREVGSKQGITTAGGAPNWGSFVAEIALDSADLPETGFLILEEVTGGPGGGAKLVVPIRFSRPPQLG